MKKLCYTFLLLLFTLSCNHRTENIQSENLFDHLKYSDLFWDTHLIDVGNHDHRPYLFGDWNEDRRSSDGVTYAGMYSRRSFVRFRVVSMEDKRITIRCRSIPAQTLTPLVNGNALPEVFVPTHWKEFSFGVAREFLEKGDNALSFEEPTLLHPLAMDFVRIENNKRNTAVQETNTVEHMAEITESFIGAEHKKIVAAPARSYIGLYLKIPPSAKLNLSYGIVKELSQPGAAVKFNVLLEEENQSAKTLCSDVIKRGRWFDPKSSCVADLSSYQNKIARLMLETVPVEGKAQRIYWSEALLQTPKPHPQPERQAAKDRPNFIIYLVDALRADHLSVYGYKQPTSPNLAKFARDSVVFDRAYSQSSWTRPSVACILSGLYASSHLVEDHADVLPSFIPTMESTMEPHGFSTYAFITNANLAPQFHFDRSFEKYVRLSDGKTDSDVLFASIQNAKYLTSDRTKPFFAYIHALDTHVPYIPPKAAYGSLPDCAEAVNGFHQPRAKDVLTEKEIQCGMAMYDREAFYSDLYFGKFIDYLKQNGLYENSIVVFTADHGEQFWEHQAWGHGKSLYEPEIRVPLMIKFPKQTFSGKRIAQTVRHIDLFPTAFELTGMKPPDRIQGESLMPVIQGETSGGHPVFSELLLYGKNKKCIVWDRYKLLANYRWGSPDDDDPQRYEMYDVIADPLEQTDIAGDKPVTFGYLRTQLRIWAEGQAKRRAAAKKPDQAVLDEQTKDVLKALGYVQ